MDGLVSLGYCPSRRAFLQASLALTSLSLLSGCGGLPPQATPSSPPRIGFLTGGGRAEAHEGFLAGLRDLGYVEGQSVVIEWRFADGRLDRLPELAADLVRLQPAAIAVNSDPAVAALKQRTQTIPIVMAQVGDPIGNGWVASLSRPGGNVTGLTTLAPELSGKRLELLKALIPGLSRVAVVRNPSISTHALLWRETQDAAAALGLSAVSSYPSRCTSARRTGRGSSVSQRRPGYPPSTASGRWWRPAACWPTRPAAST